MTKTKAKEAVGLSRIPEEDLREGPQSEAFHSSESIHMVSHPSSSSSSPNPRSGYYELPVGAEGALIVGSHTYFLHLPLADRPRRGRGPRGGAQVHRLGWWVSELGLVGDERTADGV